MEDLLPYYERELSYLRRYSEDFAKRYPKIAARLAMSGEHTEDPHVERMIQSFALLSARINKKLDDDYPEFTEALLEVLYPHYLRPFPSCSIAQYALTKAGVSSLTAPSLIPRDTQLTSHVIQGVACKFRTAYDVHLAPVEIRRVRYLPMASVPADVVLPANATGMISIEIGSTTAQFQIGDAALARLRIYLHGEQSFVAALTDAMLLNVAASYVDCEHLGRWKKLAHHPITPAGYAGNEALIDSPPRSHPAYRLLTEYFAFPEKFDFIDIDLERIAKAAGRCQSITLHLVLKNIRDESQISQSLQTLHRSHLRLFCTPVVNLFKQPGDPIRLDHTAASYSVVGDGRHASTTEIYSIDSVDLVHSEQDGGGVTEYRPFYSLRHGESAEQAGHYWYARRNEWVGENNPGYETEIAIVDMGFDAAKLQEHTLSLSVTCTNRDLPSQLAFGLEDGDLFCPEDEKTQRIAMLRRPSRTRRFDRGSAAHWRLISHLALSQVSLTQSGPGPLREMLRLYDFPQTSVSARHIDGVVDVEHRVAVQWMPGKPFATFVRGVEVVLTIDETNFVGSSLHTFVGVMDAFFATYVQLNSFTQLVVKSKRSGEEITRCLPRSGESILV